MAFLDSFNWEEALREPEKVQRTTVSATFNESFPEEYLNLVNLEELDINVAIIPEWIVKLPKLRKIMLSELAFSEGKVFELLAKLPSLEELELDFYSREEEKEHRVPFEINQLKQVMKLVINFANTYPTALDGMEALTTLIFYKCSLKKLPESLSFPSKLEEIKINGAKEVDTLPTVFCTLPELKVLSLDNCRYTTLPTEIGQMHGLYQLNVTNDKYGEGALTMLPKEIADLQELHTLNLEGNLLTKLPKEIANLKELQSLNLSGNLLVEFPIEISLLIKLQSLNLSNNKITTISESIKNLEQLRELILDNNPIGEMPKEMSCLRQLEILKLRSAEINSIPKDIAALKQLEVLELRTNHLGDIPCELGQLTNLKELYLSNNKLKGLPEELSALKELKVLFLDNNQIDNFPECIFGMEKLERVIMSNNKLKVLPEDMPLKQATYYLGLGGNSLKRLPEALKQCKDLQKIGLENNPLEEEGFLELWMSMPWCTFNVLNTKVEKQINNLQAKRSRFAVMNKFTGWEQIVISETPMGLQKVWFGHRSDEPTPHIIGPDPTDVFYEKVKQNKLMPFLTVDLHALKPEWQGKAHFLAWDYSLESLTFKLEEDKYRFVDADYDITSLTALLKALESLEDLNPKKVDWESRGFFQGRYYAVEPFHLQEMKEDEDRGTWLKEAKIHLKSDPRRFFLYERFPDNDGTEYFMQPEQQMFFAPKPIWLQSNATPGDPDGGTMEFVGQIDPSVISGDLPDGRVYMFYSPKHQLITLVGQCT